MRKFIDKNTLNGQGALGVASSQQTAAHNSVPFLSVVIPCRNGASTLRAQLESLLSQESTYAFEVVVSDNGSTDETAALVASTRKKDARVHLVDASSTPGINTARNEGINAARGPYILLCDADDITLPGWIQQYGDAFTAGTMCAGGAIERVLPNGSVLAIEKKLYTSGLPGAPEYPIGANCGFARVVYDEIGGFDTSISGGADEVDFFWRAANAGFGIDLVPGAIVRYTAREHLKDVYKQFSSYGRGHVQVAKKHGAAMQRIVYGSLIRLAAAALKLLFPRAQRHGVEASAFHAAAIREAIRILLTERAANRAGRPAQQEYGLHTHPHN